MSGPGPGQLLFRFVKHWSRRSTIDDVANAKEGRLVSVTEAVASLIVRGVPATVNAVAGEMGIDQSGASRFVKSAVDAGYLALTTDRSDGRKRQVIVTPIGHAELRDAHAWQEQVFDALTAGWSQLRREDFQAAMTDLIERSYSADGQAAPRVSSVSGIPLAGDDSAEADSRDRDRAEIGAPADLMAAVLATGEDEWLDAAEAAERVGCSVWTIRRWIREGKLSTQKKAASGADGRRAVKSFVRRSELDEKFKPAGRAEHVHRIREAAMPLNDSQKEVLEQAFSGHLLERDSRGPQEPTK